MKSNIFASYRKGCFIQRKTGLSLTFLPGFNDSLHFQYGIINLFLDELVEEDKINLKERKLLL